MAERTTVTWGRATLALAVLVTVGLGAASSGSADSPIDGTVAIDGPVSITPDVGIAPSDGPPPTTADSAEPTQSPPLDDAQWFCIGPVPGGADRYLQCGPILPLVYTNWACSGPAGVDHLGRSRFESCDPIGAPPRQPLPLGCDPLAAPGDPDEC
jgi:hypothetical protein